MKKLLKTLATAACIFTLASCGSSGPDYTYEELAKGLETTKALDLIIRDMGISNQICKIIKYSDNLTLKYPAGPIMEDIVYVNAPDRNPQEGDEVMPIKKEGKYYFYLLEDGSEPKYKKFKNARNWCIENMGMKLDEYGNLIE